MARWFNIADPCKADKHYMLPPTSRLPDLEQLIEQESYLVIHAPRQTGKTTAMLALAKQLTVSGRYTAVVISAEVGAPYRGDPGAAELAILGAWRNKKGNPQSEGLEQLDSYLARLGLDSGWLFIFDRRTTARPIEERLSTQNTTTKNKRSITVIRA